MHKKTPFCERRCAKYICRIANNARLGNPDIDVTEDLKKREVEKYEEAMKAERQHLEIVGPDDI